MTLLIHTKELKLTKATKSGQDMTFQRSFQVVSTIDTTVPPVAVWLAENIYRDLGPPAPWELPEAKLESYTLDETDEVPSRIFYGVSTYEKRNTSLGVRDDDIKSATSIRFGEATHERVVWTALDEENDLVPVLNSAGDRFAEPLMEIEKRIVVFVERSYAFNSVTPQGIMEYINSVNVNAIMVAGIPIAARSGLIKNIRFQVRVVEVGEYDWRIEYEIEIQKGATYDREILDQGLYYLEALTKKSPGAVIRDGKYYRRVPVMTQSAETGDQEKADEPVLLDGAGGRLVDVTPGNEKYITFRTKTERNWSSLGLPSTIQGVLP